MSISLLIAHCIRYNGYQTLVDTAKGSLELVNGSVINSGEQRFFAQWNTFLARNQLSTSLGTAYSLSGFLPA